MREPDAHITLDFDRERIKTVLLETYKISKEFLETEFQISSEEFVSKVNPYLDSNRVSIPVFLDLPTSDYIGMKIEVDLRRKKVFSRMYPKKVQATLNHLLKAL